MLLKCGDEICSEGFENVKVTKEAYIPAIIFALLLGFIMYGLSDKIYS